MTKRACDMLTCIRTIICCKITFTENVDEQISHSSHSVLYH